MARRRREIPPCSKTYGFPIYCATWVPLDRILAAAAAAEAEEKEDKGEAAEEKEDKGKQGGGEGSVGETSPSSRKDRLLVSLGGGGGEGRSGIPNALVISEFDLASRSLSDQPVKFAPSFSSCDRLHQFGNLNWIAESEVVVNLLMLKCGSFLN